MEKQANSVLQRYTTANIETLLSQSTATRADLRSIGRLLEALHEHDVLTYVDENLLYAVGDRFDAAIRFAPLLGSFNTVLSKAATFADFQRPAVAAQKASQEYFDFLYSLACLCIEVGLWYIGAPYKLAWRGTRRIFFARSGTLFRLGRYGGNRFVAFLMSEVHWELREALFDDVIEPSKARWVVDQVNSHQEIPESTQLRADVSDFVDEQVAFTKEHLRQYEFAANYVDDAIDVSNDVYAEVRRLFADNSPPPTSSKTSDDLLLTNNPRWSQADSGSGSGSDDDWWPVWNRRSR